MPFNLPFTDMVNDLAPMVVIFLTVIISIRITWLVLNRERLVIYKEILALMFIVYIFLLFWLVTFVDNNYGLSNFVPFREILRDDFMGYRFIKHNFGNIILFIPYGFFLCYYLRNSSFKLIMALSFLLTLTIELCQKYLVGRVFDVDDIILNMVGAYIGWLIYTLLMKFKDRLPGFARSEWFINGAVIAIVVFFVVLVIRIMHYTPDWMLP